VLGASRPPVTRVPRTRLLSLTEVVNRKIR
jgi:hypothetical protein